MAGLKDGGICISERRKKDSLSFIQRLALLIQPKIHTPSIKCLFFPHIMSLYYVIFIKKVFDRQLWKTYLSMLTFRIFSQKTLSKDGEWEEALVFFSQHQSFVGCVYSRSLQIIALCVKTISVESQFLCFGRRRRVVRWRYKRCGQDKEGDSFQNLQVVRGYLSDVT